MRTGGTKPARFGSGRKASELPSKPAVARTGAAAVGEEKEGGDAPEQRILVPLGGPEEAIANVEQHGIQHEDGNRRGSGAGHAPEDKARLPEKFGHPDQKGGKPRRRTGHLFKKLGGP